MGQRTRARLVVRPAGDRHEREADRLASRVAGTPQRPDHAHNVGGIADVRVQEGIQRARGGGRPLPEHVRAPVEQALGADFRNVRLHADAEADRLSRDLQASAFTTGRDIFLRRGHTDLASPAGRHRIAHELTHVAQQGGSEGVVQRQLVQIGPGRFRDTQTNMTATQVAGLPNLYRGDADGQSYVIRIVNGQSPFVLYASTLAKPATKPPPTTTTQPKPAAQTKPFPVPLQLPKQTPQVPQTKPTGPPAKQVTVISAPPTKSLTASAPATTKAQPQAQTQVPAWNPPPMQNPWLSPRGTTSFDQSPTAQHFYLQEAPAGPNIGYDRRDAGGYKNPKQFHKNMIPLWDQAAVSPRPAHVQSYDDKVTYYQDPNRRLKVVDSTGTKSKIIKGYMGPKRSRVVLGHRESAGANFNRIGHTRPIKATRAYNRTTAAYHALEDETWSSQSGAHEPRFMSPRPHKGSHRSYYDRTASGHTGGPWRSYTRQTSPQVVNYIKGKLHGAAKAHGNTADHQRAMIELAKLQTTYSVRTAQQLLAVIKQKGW